MITGVGLEKGMTMYFYDRTLDGIVKGTVGEYNVNTLEGYAVPVLCKAIVDPDGELKATYYVHKRVLPQELYATAEEVYDIAQAEFLKHFEEYAKAIKTVEDLCMFALEHDLLGDHAARYAFKVRCDLLGIRLDLNRID